MGTSETFGDIKRVIHDVEGIPTEEQLLTDCNNVEMSDDRTLADCSLHGSTTFILKPLYRLKRSPPDAEKVHEKSASPCTGPHEYPGDYEDEDEDEMAVALVDIDGHTPGVPFTATAVTSVPVEEMEPSDCGVINRGRPEHLLWEWNHPTEKMEVCRKCGVTWNAPMNSSLRLSRTGCSECNPPRWPQGAFRAIR